MYGWLVLLVVIGMYPPAPNNQCIRFDTPDELWERSDLVFLGTVVAKKPTGIQGSHVKVEIATFRVDTTWKGKPGKSVEVGGDLPFEAGREYLVFAAGKPASTTLLCRWTEPADRAKARLEWLKKRRSASQLGSTKRY